MLAKTGSELPIYSNFSRSQDAKGELRDRLDRLPSAERVEELCSLLSTAALRELAAEIVNGGIGHVKSDTVSLEYVKLLSSWIATVEETLAAGSNVDKIAARRRQKP